MLTPTPIDHDHLSTERRVLVYLNAPSPAYSSLLLSFYFLRTPSPRILNLTRLTYLIPQPSLILCYTHSHYPSNVCVISCGLPCIWIIYGAGTLLYLFYRSAVPISVLTMPGLQDNHILSITSWHVPLACQTAPRQLSMLELG